MTASFHRRALLAAGLAPLAAPALAQPGPYPSRPVTLLVGFPPGGQSDFIARLVQPGLSRLLGQPVVVENRAGAAGNIAIEAAMRARPDGHTLFAANGAFVTINPHTFPNLGVDPRQLVPVGMLAQSPMVLNVHTAVPARSIAEFVAWAKPQPEVLYGSVGAGTLGHVAMEYLAARTGLTNLTHVPYRGGGPANQDLLAHRFAGLFDGASGALPFIRGGQSRAILVTSPQRSPVLPEVPTAVEQGLEGFTFTNWFALFAPPATPPAIVRQVNAALGEVMASPEVRGRILAQGDTPGGGGPEGVEALIAREYPQWGSVIRDQKIRADG
ncbi:tripartite tricarboxylate transporter substrate binding protein [Roseomonas sp. GC11]|uniref:Bug family tripartite tricarboxylate transporter substrate binding protein n=1 Tax=Roseomonas sp. GC11 TaxID=2950546 RepID=UPI00210DB123|nr:tripartite tricarboxylate transporter substrate binding protein [Roseomonas sp. GC11]MCQ4159892.1 tripartite tricarboxylate transporter substrate binding protein [Roseomonas sp. GC11]